MRFARPVSRLLLFAALALTFAGCGSAPKSSQTQPVPPPVAQTAPTPAPMPPPAPAVPLIVINSSGDEISDVLAYHQWATQAGPGEFAKAVDQMKQAFAQTKSPVYRVQLALLLSMPNSPLRDDELALSLLKDWLKETRPPYSGLRAFASYLSGVIETNRDKDKRVDALQKKLEAIKSMERSLIQRDKP